MLTTDWPCCWSTETAGFWVPAGPGWLCALTDAICKAPRATDAGEADAPEGPPTVEADEAFEGEELAAGAEETDEADEALELTAGEELEAGEADRADGAPELIEEEVGVGWFD